MGKLEKTIDIFFNVLIAIFKVVGYAALIILMVIFGCAADLKIDEPHWSRNGTLTYKKRKY